MGKSMSDKNEDKVRRMIGDLDTKDTTLKAKIEFAELLQKGDIIDITELKEIIEHLREVAESHSLSGEVELVNLDSIKKKCWICGKETIQKAKYVYGKNTSAGFGAAAILGGAVGGLIYGLVVDSRNKNKGNFAPRKNCYIYECQVCKFSALASLEEEIEIEKRNGKNFFGFKGRKKEKEYIKIIV